MATGREAYSARAVSRSRYRSAYLARVAALASSGSASGFPARATLRSSASETRRNQAGSAAAARR
jgi:hypothetical protein